MSELLRSSLEHQGESLTPTLVLPSPPTTPDGAGPDMIQYDEHRTISYQLQQLPKSSTFESPEWKTIFLPFQVNNPKATTKDQPLEDGQNEVLLWTLNGAAIRHGTYVDYAEFGYDQQGRVVSYCPTPLTNPRGVPRQAVAKGHVPNYEIREHIFKRGQGEASAAPPWAGQRFGREWKFRLNGLHDSEMFSIAVLQLCRDTDFHENDEYSPSSSMRRRHAKRFLKQFRERWEPSRRWWKGLDERWTEPMRFNKARWDDVVCQYHMRSFTAMEDPWARRVGSGIVRVSGSLTVPGDKQDLNIFEVRYSIGLKTTWELDLPVFALITMTDSITARDLSHGELQDVNQWAAANIRPSSRSTGVAAFAFKIHSLLPEWETQWSNLFDEIDRVLKADLASILSPERRREIMVDGRGLQLSEFYFAILQVLRIAADWIQESMHDLRRTAEHLEWLYAFPDPEDLLAAGAFLPTTSQDAQNEAICVFKQNWESVISRQKQLGDGLLDRIARERKEVEGLRDGLFNATAVNEATKSTQLNHYIMVFTIVTIFYLPLGFIASLFALDLFTWEDSRQTKAFIATISSVAVGTYLFSALLVWVIRDPQPIKGFKRTFSVQDFRGSRRWSESKTASAWMEA